MPNRVMGSLRRLMKVGGGWTPVPTAGSPRARGFTSTPNESQTIGFLRPQKKSPTAWSLYFWGRLDSNQRRPKSRDLQSL